MRRTMNRARRGIVLVIVVAILAILMLMASTLALLARLELRASKLYESDQAMDAILMGVQKRCVDLLHEDKFGGDGFAYNYQKLEIYDHGGQQLGDVLDDGVYPPREASDGLEGDDESFDSLYTEEWADRLRDPTSGQPVQETEDFRLFCKGQNADNDLDLDGDGINDAIWLDAEDFLDRNYGALAGQRVKAQVALRFMDVGGSRADINAIGNLLDTTGADPLHAWSQGLCPYESSLEEALLRAGVAPRSKAEATARALIRERYGADNVPGGPADDSNLLGKEYFDFNCDGTADSATPKNEPSELNPDFPVAANDGQARDDPFSSFDLYDLIMCEDNGSRAATKLTETGGLSADAFRYFTARSGGAILAARSIRPQTGTQTTWDQTNTKLDAAVSLADHDLVTPAALILPESPTTGKSTALQRAIQDGLSGLADTDLYDFVWALGPVVRSSRGTITDTVRQVIARQVGVNLQGFIDADNEIPAWTVPSDRTYRAVEVTPYIVEVDAAVNASLHPFTPDITTGSVTTGTRTRLNDGTDDWILFNDADASTTWSDDEDVWLDEDKEGDYDTGEQQLYAGDDGWTTANGDLGEVFATQNNPPTGWGKYIKLVNPWNTEIKLEDYKIVIPQRSMLREWYFDTDEAELGWRSRVLSNGVEWYWDSSWKTRTPGGGEGLVIDFAGSDKVIPARGHFLIVDNEAACARAGSPTFDLAAHVLSRGYLVVPHINHMAEAGGGITSGATPPDPSDEFESAGSATVVQLQTAAGAVVMSFKVPESDCLANDEDDRDDWPVADDQNFSAQIGDPRPCWWRDPDDDGTATLQDDAWEMGSANILLYTFPQWSGDDDEDATRRLGWFNRNWRDTASDTTPAGAGDGWFLLNAAWDGLPGNNDNLLHSFPPADASGAGDTDTDVYCGTSVENEQVVNIGRMANPGCLGFVHAGMEWGTLSLGLPAASGNFGEVDLVYLRNFADYLTGPFSPYEDNADNDGDDKVDGADTGLQEGDRSGAEVRLRGRINVNTAPKKVLRAALSQKALGQAMGWSVAATQASVVADAIITERQPGTNTGPFSSVDDLMERVPEIFELADSGQPNCFRRETLARFVYNNVTVRSDVWAVIGRVRLVIDADGDGVLEPEEVSQGTFADRRFYFVLDRSYDPIRVIARRLLAE